MKYPQLVSMPSAVSDWLEEQLEARGIDAVVYTRYVLSLLHSHTVDVVHPDDDLQFSRLKKEVRRSSGGRKRFRRSSSDWWRHAQVDAEQIKRSAAVECLMSASDQNCEIESLVDELCEKLKEVESAPASPVNSVDAPAEAPNEKITPLELAEKYYAAFPPLGPRTPAADRKTISLTPKWKPASASPIKKKVVRKQGNRQTSYDQKLHTKVDGETMKPRSQNKQRFPYFNRTKNTATRKPETFTCWDFSMFSNKKGNVPKQKSLEEVSEAFDQCVEVNRAVWTNDEDMNMYEDLPVDIQELLDSPSPHDDTVEMMNMANMRDDGKREFIPYGTNIISSIWSTDQDISYDNTFNSAVDRRSDNDSALDFKFSSISIDNQINAAEDWPIFNSMSENETNNLFENNRAKKSSFLGGFRSLPGDWSKFEGEKDECFENEKTLNHLAISLMKLNHNKEKSCFKEIMPRSQFASHGHPFNPFGRTTSMFGFNSRHGIGIDREKEDLLTSERSHFKPIAQKVDLRPQGHYADGATFVISSSLEKVEYKRSESGTMLLETEYGQNKKYYEYKVDDSAATTSSSELEFVLKFSICQNDKACQTEEELSEVNLVLGKVKNDSDDERYSPKKPSCVDKCGEETRCACPNGKISVLKSDDFSVTCPVHRSRPESALAEILWKYEAKTCEKCNNNNMTWSGNWSSEGQMDPDWESQGLRNIWSGGGEVCQACSSLNGGNACRPPPSLQLREDISQDGEQLLSDLSVLQKTYMEDLPSSEISCDISELVSSGTKRRHSFTVEDMDVHNRSSWSFASRLEEDCLIQMSTLPTLRSVTL